MTRKNSVRSKVAVVTGAGSGIGRALSVELARRGARLALSDVNEDGLAETASAAKDLGAEVHTARLDVSDRQAVVAYAAAVPEHYGVVHQLYNNAGVAGRGRTVLATDWSVYDRIMSVDYFGVLHGTKAFLPALIASGDGHLVNMSSLNGIFGQARMSDYCSAKFAVRGFTESLRSELVAARAPVRVTVVHPGGVRTNIATAALADAKADGVEITAEDEKRARIYNKLLLRMPAEKAATIVVDGVEAGRPRVLVGSDAKFLDRWVRLAPRAYPDVSVRFERRLFRWT